MPLFLYTDPFELHPSSQSHREGSWNAVLFCGAFVSQQPAVMLPVAGGIAALIVVAGALPTFGACGCCFHPRLRHDVSSSGRCSSRGTPLIVYGPLRHQRRRLQFALGMAIKLDTFLGVGICFSPNQDRGVAYALTRVGMPYSWGFANDPGRSVGARSSSTLRSPWRKRQRCRGFNFDEGNILQRVRRYARSLCPSSWARCVAPTVWRWHSKRRFPVAAGNGPAYEQFPVPPQPTPVALSVAIAVAVGYLALWHAGSRPFRCRRMGEGGLLGAWKLQALEASLLYAPSRDERSRQDEIECVPATAPGTIDGGPRRCWPLMRKVRVAVVVASGDRIRANDGKDKPRVVPCAASSERPAAHVADIRFETRVPGGSRSPSRREDLADEAGRGRRAAVGRRHREAPIESGLWRRFRAMPPSRD